MTVADSTGTIVATGTGTSQDVDWTWDATAAAHGRVHRGRSRRATRCAARPARSARRLSRSAITLGDGGSADDHAERRRADRLEPDRLHAQRSGNRDGNVAWSRRAQISPCSSRKQRKPGKQTFRFTAAGVADGRYEIVLSATDGIATVTTAIPVLVDRTVRGFAGTPAAVSPNGDGTRDDAHVRVRAHASCVGPARHRSGGKDARVRLLRRPPGRSRSPCRWNPSGLKDGKYAARADRDERARHRRAHRVVPHRHRALRRCARSPSASCASA